MRIILLSLACLSLGACSTKFADMAAQEAARSAVTPVVEEQLPGVEVEPAIDCVIDNASASQISSLATDAVLGPDEQTVQIVADITSKPSTIKCLAINGLPALF